MRMRILTGDRPTGPMHLGHFVGSLENRVRLQDEYDCFFIVADYQVLTDHLKETEHTEQYIRHVVLDWLSVGLDPGRSTFFIQSRIPQIAELTMYFSMMVTLARLQRNPTVKEEFRAAGPRAMSYGFLGYPVSQAADILVVRSNLVPVGEDNVAHVEQAREIARTFNRTFGEVFPVPEALVGEVPRLPGLDGQKMSTSRHNAIFLSDAPEEVRSKVGMAITDPTRIRVSDKGHPDTCSVYQGAEKPFRPSPCPPSWPGSSLCEGGSNRIWGTPTDPWQRGFAPLHSPFFAACYSYHCAFNGAEAPEVEERCRQGRTGCVACKENLAEQINSFLEPIRERRAVFEAGPSIVREAIEEGNRRVCSEGKETIELVREAMHFDYRGLMQDDVLTNA